MAKKRDTFTIGIPIYDGVDLLDVAAPYETFNWMGQAWAEKKTSVLLVGQKKKVIKSRDKFHIVPDTTFKKCPQLDVLWVPGADPQALEKTMLNCAFLNFLKKQSQKARYVTSVCEGAFLLASAGLLDGHQVTTHWAFIGCLKLFPEVEVVDGTPRYVISGNRITGGGISSGLDEALQLVSMIAGEQVAQSVQLNMQYFPEPPFTQTITVSPDCTIKGMAKTIKAVSKQNCGK
ncbi:MAG TPA: DJ-1/PfpI family protein [Blastocatellia bacterium]|nr:DJ-1/PfpI family protein [Blastocatellia bacterium]